MKILFSCFLFVLVQFSANATESFTGIITDTMCGKAHGMVRGQPDNECVALCVKGTSSQYALYDGKSVFKLTDQKAAAKFSAQRVKVTGILNDKTRTIKVSSMEPEGSSK